MKRRTVVMSPELRQWRALTDAIQARDHEATEELLAKTPMLAAATHDGVDAAHVWVQARDNIFELGGSLLTLRKGGAILKEDLIDEAMVATSPLAAMALMQQDVVQPSVENVEQALMLFPDAAVLAVKLFPELADGGLLLQRAIQLGRLDAIAAMREQGADPRARDASGKSAFDYVQTAAPHLRAAMAALLAQPPSRPPGMLYNTRADSGHSAVSVPWVPQTEAMMLCHQRSGSLIRPNLCFRAMGRPDLRADRVVRVDIADADILLNLALTASYYYPSVAPSRLVLSDGCPHVLSSTAGRKLLQRWVQPGGRLASIAATDTPSDEPHPMPEGFRRDAPIKVWYHNRARILHVFTRLTT